MLDRNYPMFKIDFEKLGDDTVSYLTRLRYFTPNSGENLIQIALESDAIPRETKEELQKLLPQGKGSR